MAQPKATTPEAVLAAAAEVFREKGYYNSTLDDIARAAGISKPTVYRYAKSKQWLLERIAKTVRVEMTKSSEGAWDSSLPAEERFRLWIKANVECSVYYRSFYLVSFGDQRAVSKRAAREAREYAHAVTARMERLLQDCIDAGYLSLPGDLTVYSNLLQSMLVSLHRWYDPDGAIGTDELTDHIVFMLSGMVDPQAKPKRPTPGRRSAARRPKSTPAA